MSSAKSRKCLFIIFLITFLVVGISKIRSFLLSIYFSLPRAREEVGADDGVQVHPRGAEGLHARPVPLPLPRQSVRHAALTHFGKLL